jgi:outer membrane lipoprotein-sorting protein
MPKLNIYAIILFIGLLFCSVSGLAQYQNATDEQKKEIASKIAQASANTNTMQCDFTQVKESSFMDDRVTSEGKMFYKKTNKIRWEYTNPYQYVFSTDGKNVVATFGDKKTAMPTNQRKLFDEICKVMVSGVSGRDLVDSPDFDTDFFVGSDDYKLVLVSKKKEVKALFSSIQLYVGKSDSRVHSIELVEKSGDKTTITLKNIQLNTTINDAIFTQ